MPNPMKRSLLGVPGRVFVVAAVAVLFAAASSGARAQDERSSLELLEDFNFYVNIANIELANSYANALLDRGLTPEEFVGLVEDSPTLATRFDRAYRRALAHPGLAESAAQLGKLYENGRLARARNPEEIQRNIGLLTGTKRGQLLARERLRHAGEYAVPQLLEVLLERRDPQLETEVQAALIEMGRGAILPLSVALLGVDEATQETLARVLGRIPYNMSLPYLYEVARTTRNDAVRSAAVRAIENLSGQYDAGVSVAALYRELGERYYAEPRSLTSFPNEDYQLLWGFDPAIGLEPIAILTEVFHEARAMELAERALRLDPNDEPSVALWVAANFSREIDQSEEYENPVYGADRRNAEYYAVAAGPRVVQNVLARALNDRDTRLARKAIEALAMSAGEAGLRSDSASGRALVDALSYPDRRVQYEAAIAIGSANPLTMFEGAERVVPILAEAIREASNRYALVIAREADRQQALRSILESEGYIVLPPGGTLDAVSQAIADAPGIDLILSDLTAGSTQELIESVRRSTRLRATPVLAMVSVAGITQIGGRFDADHLTWLAREGVSPDQLREASRQLVEKASGAPVSDEEGRAYAMGALDVLHELSVGGSTVFDVSDATVPLLAALNETTGDVRLRVADVVSYIAQQRAQVAIMDAAMGATGRERIALMERVIRSAKRFGNLLEPRHLRWIMQRAREGGNDEATAAAALMGALNLPNDQFVPILLGEG